MRADDVSPQSQSAGGALQWQPARPQRCPTLSLSCCLQTSARTLREWETVVETAFKTQFPGFRMSKCVCGLPACLPVGVPAWQHRAGVHAVPRPSHPFTRLALLPALPGRAQ